MCAAPGGALRAIGPCGVVAFLADLWWLFVMKRGEVLLTVP
jgi:hypothetical protein